ncbi:FAD-dependent oxidoreductase [Streptomyces phaeochromogenes]|uniref:FAD-dependent oxidoreductase n=1 Tax=Streptomyces phaeochromogenes TaxID=1923 RepID=UPI003F4D1D76
MATLSRWARAHQQGASEQHDELKGRHDALSSGSLRLLDLWGSWEPSGLPWPFGCCGSPCRGDRSQGDPCHTYAQLKKTQDWVTDVDTTDAAALTARVAREFDGWAPALTALITDSNTQPALRPIFTLPAGHRWDHAPGVTLLGDAAHLRAPKGQGANVAMQDGAELGRALAAHPGDAETALTAYEQAMFARAAAVEADDDGFYTIMIDDHAPHSLLALMTGAEPSRIRRNSSSSSRSTPASP